MTSIEKEKSPEMFDAIAKRYDVINTILSLGLHKKWKRRFVDQLPEGQNLQVLDIATGTGDIALACAHKKNIQNVTAIDPSEGMLEVAKERAHDLNIDCIHGASEDLPFDAEKFDVITMSFGIRNVPNVIDSLQEMHRVLKRGGSVMIMEFSRPRNRLVQILFDIYVSLFGFTLGLILARNPRAYTYLGNTIKNFPSGDDFEKLLINAGFGQVERVSMLLGAVTIYKAVK